MTSEKKDYKTEFAVEMTCDDCVKDISNVLKEVPGITHFDIDLNDQRVVVEGRAPPSVVARTLRSTGRTVIVRGQGVLGGEHSGAAVCIFEAYTYKHPSHLSTAPPKDSHGLARFLQIDLDTCLIDITVEGLPPGKHGVHIHELGDISNGCESTGVHFNPSNVEHSDPENGHIGDLGNLDVDEKGWGDLILESKRVKVWDIIGRSIVISALEDDLGKGIGEKFKQSKVDGNSGPGIIAGIVARSAGVFENAKKVCTCSGATLWEEARVIQTANL